MCNGKIRDDDYCQLGSSSNLQLQPPSHKARMARQFDLLRRPLFAEVPSTESAPAFCEPLLNCMLSAGGFYLLKAKIFSPGGTYMKENSP